MKGSMLLQEVAKCKQPEEGFLLNSQKIELQSLHIDKPVGKISFSK